MATSYAYDTKAAASGKLVKLVAAVPVGAAVFVALSTAPDWAPQADWQLPGLAITIAVGAALLVVLGLELRGLAIAGVAALLVGFLSVNDGPLQPPVFAQYGRLVQVTTGHPLCAEGTVLNRAETACVRDPKAKPVKPAPKRKAHR